MSTWALANIGRLVTGGPHGTLVRASLRVEGSRIAAVAEGDGALTGAGEVVDAGGSLVTAGLIDAHTHPVYAGDRFDEIARRSAGATYAEIAASGGGVASTVEATRAAPDGDLRAAVTARLARMRAAGTTTVEAKTGYHLDREGELAAVGLLAGFPGVHVTFLAAHALPPGWDGSSSDYAGEVAAWCRDAAAAGAESVDVFCDEGYFSVDDTRTVLTAGRAAGLALRVHADELARTGGALLAAELGARSADHLLCATDDDVAALAAAGVVATLCPATALAMGRTPPARAFLDAGVTVALGSDHNPGTSGISDMTVVVALAVAGLGLSVDEALAAATAGGARSLGVDGDRGRVEPGRRADLVLWDAEHEGAFAWAWGVRPRQVWKDGAPS